MKTTNTESGASGPDTPPPSLTHKLCLAIGSAGLLLAMATDTIAVLGRHTGFTLIGSIELVQIAIILLASSAMVMTTRLGAHATVHILTERLSVGRTALLARIAALTSAGFCLLVVAGSAWVTADVWFEHERTELLHIPLRWFRVALAIAFVVMTGLFIRHSLRSMRRDP